ncbi:MAG: hypothetical protein RBT59_02935 [Arcobacteraceae bacterium]|nr:hypothetical protein [Arcobacteraceae bacterium]
MKQGNLFDMTNEIVIKKFSSKDVFFNNGIVNLYQFLKERDFEFEYDLNQNELILKIDSQKQDEIYNRILNVFLKNEKIVTFNDKNPRIFFDFTLNKFIQSSKVNIKGGGSNDSKNSLIRVHIDDLNISKDELKKQEEIYLNSFNNTNKDEFSLSKCYYDKSKQEIYILSTLEEHIQKYTDYLVKSNKLALNSSIHSFEDGQSSFHDMLPNEKVLSIDGEKIKAIKIIDKWNALIYWFGGRTKRFYNFSYFIYPNSSNLDALNKFKEFLQIGDEKIEYRDERGNVIPTSSNIDFFEVLSKDEIINKHFYISKSAEEFELKFFMYIFSMMYHIEERYEKANERRRERQKELFETLQYLSFVIYTEDKKDKTIKTSLTEYTKAYRLIQFFQILKENNLFKYLEDVLIAFSLSQGNKEVNLNIQHWCQKILNFSNLRKEYYLTSFNILKNDSKGFGKLLCELEQSYLKHILGGKDMSIHEDSKKVGDGIGYFCAVTKDKDLLFKLRNVKNYKQLVSYFKDLKFSALKNEKEARFSKEFNDSLESILENIEQNWEIARDYIAIYAIDKFKATSYQNSKSNQGE